MNGNDENPITDPDEVGIIVDWVRTTAPNYLKRKPNMVTDAPDSKAVRFRWFSVVISERRYLVGLNIHYGGNLGGLWVKNRQTEQALGFHPRKDPEHGLPPRLVGVLRDHLRDQNNRLYQLLHPRTRRN
jgi:hypothetical protein